MMKRLSLFAFTALAAIACNKSELEVENPNTSFEGTPMSITVEMPSSADTKLDLDQSADTWITKWTEGDNLTAYHYSGTAISNATTSFALSDVSADGKSATFTGSYDDTQDGMALIYAGANPGNMLSGQAALTLANQKITLSTKDAEDVVTANPSGALSEYSYMISEKVDFQNVPSDYNSVAVKHLTALMELELQLKNLPEGKTFKVSNVEIGITDEDFDDLQKDLAANDMAPRDFAMLHTQESYDITKSLSSDEFATHPDERGVYNLEIEGCEVSNENNTFNIPFNAFPFTVKQGEYFTVTVSLEQYDSAGNITAGAGVGFDFDNQTGADLEFGRGKHHTISYSYECDSEDFENIWDGVNFTNVDDAKAVLGEPVVADVYEIGSARQLAAMSYLVNNDNENYGSVKYVLVSSIDLNGKSWTPIGTIDNTFSGNFNGQSCTINGLFIDASENSQGLFGYAKSATISDLSVDGSITAKISATGGIVGKAESSVIKNCYNYANIEAGSSAGGVVGSLDKSTVINCYNSGIVNGLQNIGGVVGIAINSDIINCYNAASITGKYGDVGGVSGQVRESSSIINCYNSASVTNTSDGVPGGVVGTLYNSSSSTSCYWNSDNFSGSGVGKINETSSADVTAKTDTEMRSSDFVTLLNNGAYTYNQTSLLLKAFAWTVAMDPLYPVHYILDSNPTFTPYDMEYNAVDGLYEINNAKGLKAFADLVNGKENSSLAFVSLGTENSFESYNSSINGKLTKSIDLSEEVCSEGLGSWIPIGDYESSYYDEHIAVEYKGTFDGGGFEVSGLYINNSLTYQALFGQCSEGGKISNVTVSGSVTAGVKNGFDARGVIAGVVGCNYGTIENCVNLVEITAKGGLAGGITCYNYGEITKCANKANITSKWQYTAGIAGINYKQISLSYNEGRIESSMEYIGGIVGQNSKQGDSHIGTVSNCYNTGYIKTNSNGKIGGVVGRTSSNTVVEYCYNVGEIYSGNYSDNGVYTGGVVGLFGTGSQCNDSYYLFIDGMFELPRVDPEKLTLSSAATAITTSADDMKTAGFLSKLNSAAGNEADYWVFVDGANDGFPVQRWQVKAD